MESSLPIHDLFIQPLHADSQDSWEALKAYAFDDHLLKRIGQIEVIELSAGTSLPPILHEQADELWMLIEGGVSFKWRDDRDTSPTKNESHEYMADRPVRVLAPFGVEFNISAHRDSTLLRISTHAGDLQDLASQVNPESQAA